MPKKIHMEGLTFTVANVKRSVAFYRGKLGFKLEINAAPHFALIRVGGAGGGTIGLISWNVAKREGAKKMTAKQKMAIHAEFSTSDLDGLYKKLRAKGVRFKEPPHDEPWERSMTAVDPDGYHLEFAQGRRGKNQLRA